MERQSPTEAPLLTAERRSDHPPPRRPVPWREFTHPNGRGLATVTGFGLGVATNVSLALLLLAPSTAPFAVYLFLLVCFHMSEYLLTAAFRPDTLSFDNFLLNHSTAYHVCIAAAWFEYWLEFALLPGWLGESKRWNPLSTLGLATCLVGLVARAVGMATASTNFSHKIEETKRPEHRLVTHGIYAYLRHPAYFGFFWWSVGTQVLLANPLSTAVYTLATWYFFYDRIPHEEALLQDFFGEAYSAYKRRTFIGIPLIEWATKTFPADAD